ncbi:MAG: hypothetical protein RLN78_08030 [Phycisphaerales bacterium]
MLRFEVPVNYRIAALKKGLQLRSFLKFDPENACEQLIINVSTLGAIPLYQVILSEYEHTARCESVAFGTAITCGSEERRRKGFGTV